MSNNFAAKNCRLNKKTSLDDLQTGQSAQIAEYTLPAETKTRLFEMGLVPGTEVTMAKRSPLGDPLIEVRGYRLCIRKRDAKQIWVK